MKRAIIALLLLFSINSITKAYAEDVLIIHQGYANSHIKWKNRLEDAGHTVTSVQVGSDGSSFPTNTASYEQIYDLINLPYHLVQDYSGGAQIESAYKALLARGGTLYLQTENPGCCNGRNQNIIDFIEDDLGGGTITYHTSSYSSNSITVHNSNESWLSGFSGTVTFSAGGVLTAIGILFWLYVTAFDVSYAEESDVPSVAILPFENKGAPQDEFYAYAISSDLITDITSAGLIRVASLADVEKLDYKKIGNSEFFTPRCGVGYSF